MGPMDLLILEDGTMGLLILEDGTDRFIDP